MEVGAERETESKTERDPEHRTQTPQRPKRAWEGREEREGRRRRGPGIAPGPQKLRAPRFPLPAEPEAGVSRVLPQEEGLAGFSRHPGRPQGPQRRPRQPHGVPTALLCKLQGAPNSPTLCVGAAGTPCSQRAGTRALTKAGGTQRIVGETPRQRPGREQEIPATRREASRCGVDAPGASPARLGERRKGQRPHPGGVLGNTPPHKMGQAVQVSRVPGPAGPLEKRLCTKRSTKHPRL